MTLRTSFSKIIILAAIVLVHVSCLNYRVDVSSRQPYSNLVGNCFVSNRRMMVYTWNKGAGTGTHIGGGQFGSPVTVHRWLEKGEIIRVKKIFRDHIGYYGDLLEPEVEFTLNNAVMRAGAFQLFSTENGEFGPNPKWIVPCQ